MNLFWISLVALSTHGAYSQSGSKNLTYYLTEECSNGTLVGRLENEPILNDDLFFYRQTNVGPQNSVTYQLLTTSKLFQLDPHSGELVTVSRIDREQVCPEDDQPSSQKFDYKQSMLATQTSGCKVTLQILRIFNPDGDSKALPKTDVIHLDIQILDLNDNAPIWPDEQINVTVPEHSPLDHRVLLPTAYDPDYGPENTTYEYELMGVANPMGGSLVQQNLANSFKLETELISEPTEGLAPWTIDPIWRRRKFRLYLRVVSDLDYEPSELGLNLQSQNMRIQQNAQVDKLIEENKNHPRSVLLKIVAKDRGRPFPLSSSVNVNVTVSDVNDQKPIFLPPEGSTLSSNTDPDEPVVVNVQENAPVKKVIYKPRVYDPDISDQNKLKFRFANSMSKASKAVFGIKEATGDIYLIQSPDFEQKQEHMLQILVSDGEFQSSQIVQIKVLNVNDHEPLIKVKAIGSTVEETSAPGMLKTIQLSVMEQAPEGSIIATISVSDKDQENISPETLGSNLNGLVGEEINCRIRHDNFALESLYEGAKNQYKLVTRGILDRELSNEQSATLTCHDAGRSPKSAQINFRVLIEDKNDNPPKFVNEPMHAKLLENAPKGTLVYTVKAIDADTGMNAQLSYSIDDENSPYFAVDPVSGEVTSLRSFDREEREKFEIQVTARDCFQAGKPISADSKASNATLLVTIEDVNDCEPYFPQAIYHFSIAEDAKMNHFVGEVMASDCDVTEKFNKVSNEQ
ncbi:hypothetical protein Ciccas_010615 [Cichlidogyrus casuarinus]|uniref:Cadherin domain-containing protein n=1 Tax=Cichlidogyrus casuarinus TaxID=1844966 RepID=A0ABD2PUS0_9PLAT